MTCMKLGLLWIFRPTRGHLLDEPHNINISTALASVATITAQCMKLVCASASPAASYTAACITQSNNSAVLSTCTMSRVLQTKTSLCTLCCIIERLEIRLHGESPFSTTAGHIILKHCYEDGVVGIPHPGCAAEVQLRLLVLRPLMQ
jgi:hypothetical protein